jgi:starvation-inducible DNA-binding protein
MAKLTALHVAGQSDTPLSKAIQEVLTSTYGLYLATHNYHWNVEGQKFLPLHSLFGAQYNQLFIAIDVIAERMRSIGAYALPFEGDNIVQSLKKTSNALNKEKDSNARADRMVHNLILLQDTVIKDCQLAKKAAQNVRDAESENLMIERMTAHQKSNWMLRSTVK